MFYCKCFVKSGSLNSDNFNKLYRLYDICLSIYNKNSSVQNIYFSIRFETLKKAEKVLPYNLKGNIPSNHIFSDYTKNYFNIYKRVEEIQEYLNKLFNNPQILENKEYHKILGIKENNSKILCTLVKQDNNKLKNKNMLSNIKIPNNIILMSISMFSE